MKKNCLLIVLFVILCALEGLAQTKPYRTLKDPQPGKEVVLRLETGDNNPRNSEGDFITLKDGRILFIYTHYTGQSGSDWGNAYLASRFSSDNGKTWSQESKIEVQQEGLNNVMSVSMLRLLNGSIALFNLKIDGEFLCSPWMRISTDEGNTWGKPWKGPIEIPELSWEYEADSPIVSVADVTPGWHSNTGKMIAIGIMVRYTKNGKQLLDKSRSHDAVYTVFDPKTSKWTPWEILANVPGADSKFYFVNPGNVQWIVKPNGNILLPIYFSGAGSGESSDQSVTVLECSFDGVGMAYLGHGSELTVKGGRGLVEPSLTMFNKKYYLTLRNDFRGYVTTSEDGLNFSPKKEWTLKDILPIIKAVPDAKYMILNFANAAVLSLEEMNLVKNTDLIFDTSGRTITNMAEFLNLYGTNKFAFGTHSPILDYLTGLLRIESLYSSEADEKTKDLLRSGNAKTMLGL